MGGSPATGILKCLTSAFESGNVSFNVFGEDLILSSLRFTTLMKLLRSWRADLFLP